MKPLTIWLRVTNCLRGDFARCGTPAATRRFRLATLVLALLMFPSLLYAQAPPPAPVVTASRSWYFEALIVAVMAGLALFVVCRSSRRN